MKIICSWCRGEGRVGLVGEKAPLEDLRETHGICLGHQRAMKTGGATNLCRATEIGQYVALFDGRETITWLTRFYRLVLSMAHISASLKYLDRRRPHGN